MLSETSPLDSISKGCLTFIRLDHACRHKPSPLSEISSQTAKIGAFFFFFLPQNCD